jgi:hypothetical protein
VKRKKKEKKEKKRKKKEACNSRLPEEGDEPKAKNPPR